MGNIFCHSLGVSGQEQGHLSKPDRQMQATMVCF